MGEIITYQQLLSEILIEQLAEILAKAGPGHYMRIEGLPYEVMEQTGASLQKNSSDAKVVVLSNKPRKKYEVSATKLIELRNSAEDSHPLLVLIPSNLRTAAEDSFDRATFKQIEVGVTMLIASHDPPSLPNAVIELSSAIILHRFNSPAWLRHIQKSVAALNDLTSSQLASLQPGEAFIWANKATHAEWTKKAIKVMTRPRVTMHGGSTQKAVE